MGASRSSSVSVQGRNTADFDFNLGASNSVLLNGTDDPRTDAAELMFDIDADVGADSVVIGNVTAHSTGDFNGVVAWNAEAESGGMLTALDAITASQSQLASHASDAAQTSIIGYHAIIDADNGGSAQFIGSLVNTGFDIAHRILSGGIQWLDTDGGLSVLTAASGNGGDMAITAGNAVTAGTGGDIQFNAGIAAGANENGFILLNSQTHGSGGTDDKTVSITATLNDSGAAGGSDLFTLIQGNITETDTTGWDNVLLMSLSVDGSPKVLINNDGEIVGF